MINKIKNKLKFSVSSKNVLKILSGTLMGQAITFITLPIMTRIYGAAVMGVWAVIASFSAIINAFSDLGLNYSIMMEDEEKTLDTYMVISTISLIISLLCGFVMYLYYKINPSSDDIPALIMAIMIVLQVWTAKQLEICYSWLNREKDYKTLMRNPVVNNVSMAIIAVILGVIGYKKYGYYIAFLGSTVFTILNMKSKLPRKTFTLNVKLIFSTIKRHISFVKYQMPANIFTQVKNSLPSLLMKTIFGSEAAGYLSVSTRLLQVPISLIASSVGRVFFADVAELKRKGMEIKDVVHKNISKMFKMAMLIFLVFFAFGDIGAVIFLGDKWVMAGQMLRIMSFMGLFTFISMSIQGICIVLDKQKYVFFTGIAQSCGGLIAYLLMGYFFKNVLVSLSVYVGITTIIQMVYFSAVYKAMDLSIWLYLKDALTDIVVMFGGMIILRFIAMQFGLVSNIFF